MRVVVTGAGGFIGSHLVERLLSGGHRVLGLDVYRGIPENLSDASKDKRFSYAACDMKESKAVLKALENADAVFHLAAVVGVDAYVSDPLGVIDNNVMGTRNVLGSCIRNNARLIATSTSEIYGKNQDVPWAETADRVLGAPTIDRWSYSTSKALCEHMINAAHRRYRTPTTIVRPFNVYGPRQRPSFVIPATIMRVLKGEQPVIYDDGNQTRCFTYVGDLVHGLSRCLESSLAIGETFNMGSEKETKVKEIVRIVLDVCGSSLKPQYLDTSKAFGGGYEDIYRRIPNVSKARKLLGWTARTPVRKGIERTVSWARSQYRISG